MGVDGLQLSEESLRHRREAMAAGLRPCWGHCGAMLPRPEGYCPACLELEREKKRTESRTRMLYTVPSRYKDNRFDDLAELAKRVKGHGMIGRAKGAVFALSTFYAGPTGAGKTSLACAQHYDMAGDRSGLFADSRALVRARLENKLGAGEAELVDDAMTVGVLLIDELGVEKGRGTAETVIEEIVHARHAAELATIYTSPFDKEKLKIRYDEGVIRRIFEDATVIVLGARI